MCLTLPSPRRCTQPSRCAAQTVHQFHLQGAATYGLLVISCRCRKGSSTAKAWLLRSVFAHISRTGNYVHALQDHIRSGLVEYAWWDNVWLRCCTGADLTYRYDAHQHTH